MTDVTLIRSAVDSNKTCTRNAQYLHNAPRQSRTTYNTHPIISTFFRDCCICMQVTAHVGDAELEGALKGADLVVIPAGKQ
jgi:hypothetical protein